MHELTNYERQLVMGLLDDVHDERRLEAHMALAEDAVVRADLPQALEYATKGLSIARSMAHDLLVASTLMTHAAILWDLGRLDEAGLDYVDAASIYKAHGEPESEGLAFLRLAWIAFESETIDAVFGHLQRAVQVYEDPANERVVSNLIRMSEESLRVGEFELGLQCSELAADIASGFDDEPMHWNARGYKMLALHALDRSAEAVEVGER